MTLYFIDVVLIMSRLNFESTFHRSNSKYLMLSTLHYLLLTPRSFNLYMHIVMKHLYHTRVECICQLKIVIILFFVSNEINVWRNRELTFSRSVFFISCFGLHTVYSFVLLLSKLTCCFKQTRREPSGTYICIFNSHCPDNTSQMHKLSEILNGV